MTLKSFVDVWWSPSFFVIELVDNGNIDRDRQDNLTGVFSDNDDDDLRNLYDADSSDDGSIQRVSMNVWTAYFIPALGVFATYSLHFGRYQINLIR